MNRRDLLKSGRQPESPGDRQCKSSDAAGQSLLRIENLRTAQRSQAAANRRVLPAPFYSVDDPPRVGPIGCFNVISGLLNPALIVLIDYPSLAAVQSTHELMMTDKEFGPAWKAFETAELPYVRYESALLRAFDSHQKLEVPPTDEKRAPRVFELRTYESRNAFSLRDKIAMFNQEEIKIFRDCGFAPVFFGEGVIAPRLPHLTYLVGFDNMAAREKAWDTFRANPDWARVRVKPGWTDPKRSPIRTPRFCARRPSRRSSEGKTEERGRAPSFRVLDISSPPLFNSRRRARLRR
jgi:hypothetical protein